MKEHRKDFSLMSYAENYAEAQRKIKECREKKGKKIDFSGLCLKKIPPEITELNTLTELDLQGDFKTLPDSFGNLAALEKLSLFAKKSLVLPKTIGNLSALRMLWAHAPDIKSIPDSIGSCKNLKFISIESDTLSSLPESFCGLKNLEELRLDTFALKALPGKFGSLAALKSIDIFSGALTTLPESTGNLKNLKVLCLDAYNVKKLPGSFRKLSYIKNMDIQIRNGEPGEEKQFVDFVNMGFRYRWKILESYSLKEIESILCSAPDYTDASRAEKLAFREIMMSRRRKLDNKFKWTEENKKKIARVSDEFLKAWEDGFSKARMLTRALHKKEQDKGSFHDKYHFEIVLYPEIVRFREGDRYTDQLYRVITSYLNPETELNKQFRYDSVSKNEDRFRKNIHTNRELSWNIEGLGDHDLDDYYICYALHILHSHNEWAIEDIIKINNISIEVKVYYDGGEF